MLKKGLVVLVEVDMPLLLMLEEAGPAGVVLVGGGGWNSGLMPGMPLGTPLLRSAAPAKLLIRLNAPWTPEVTAPEDKRPLLKYCTNLITAP